MKIETCDWSAHNDTTPGAAALRVHGKVTVNNASAQAQLVPYKRPQPKDLVLRLDLIVTQADEAALQVLTEREVVFTQPGGSPCHTVQIHHDGEILAGIRINEAC